MDPITPETSTLHQTIAHIAETAASSAGPILKQLNGEKSRAPSIGRSDGEADKRDQRATVRWVLGAPKRLQESIDKGERNAAIKDWEEIKILLDQWEGVSGVDQIREECLKVSEVE